MLLIWIPVSVLAMYIIMNTVYGKLWRKGLRAQLRFEERDVEEGDSATLVETMTNDKILPLPVIKLSFKVDRSIVIDEDRNATVTDRTNVVEYFGLGGHEAVTRRQPVRASHRGYYLIEEAGLALPDFFSEGVRYMNTAQSASLLVCPRMLEEAEVVDISRQIIGEVVSRNRLYQDVFSFRGIREYTREDPLSAVNWKASARTGEYMVNIRDYTSGPHVRFLLDLEPPSIRYSEELLEQGIRLAYTLAGRCIQAQIPVSLVSNGRDVITGNEVETASGSSERHLGAIGEALARVSLSLEPRPFWMVLRQERRGAGGWSAGDSGVRGANDLRAANDPRGGLQLEAGDGGAVGANEFRGGLQLEAGDASAGGANELRGGLRLEAGDGSAGGANELRGGLQLEAGDGGAVGANDLWGGLQAGGGAGLDESTTLCMISSGLTDALLEEAAELSNQCGGLLWICVLDQEVERKAVPAGIRFVPVEY